MSTFIPVDARIQWSGRRVSADSVMNLTGSASSFRLRFKGDQCRIHMQSFSASGHGHFISYVLDGVHSKRISIISEMSPLEIPVSSQKEFHDLEVFKESEPACGFLRIVSIEAEELITLPALEKMKIEFIGNSITAGMSSDDSIVPCNEGGPCDQHNAYESYGAITARTLNMDLMISAVSGIGVYRNFSSDYPVMTDVYESTMLTGQEPDPKWDFSSFIPDIVCVNLGTNDFSDGGDIIPREPFDAKKFIAKYVELLNKIRNHYRETKFVLLQHGMSGDHNMDVFRKSLESVVQQFIKLNPQSSVEIFAFSPSAGAGCLGHPDVEEHHRMAEELIEFLSRFESR